MSIVGSEQWMYSAGAEFYDFPIEQSLRFNDDDNAYLNRTPASAGNLNTWTWSGWVKRGNLGGFQNFFIAGTSSSSYTTLFFDSSNKLSFQQLDSSTETTRGTSLAVFRDISAWYNIIFAYDSTQATNSNGLKLYVNGVQQTLSFDAYQQNSNAYINSTSSHGLGGLPSVTANDFDGYFADVNFIDGQQLDATSFGELKSGIWIPKDTSGLTFGTNGFRLEYADSAAIGDDTSGNTNDWTANNLVASDVLLDGVTNNFCTYNPNSRFDGNGTFSEGNLRFSGNSSGDMSTRTSTVIPAGMKFYFEAIYNEEGGSGGQARLGIDQTGSTADREKSGTGLFSFDFRGSAGTPQADDEGTLTTYGSQPAEGDVVGIAVDLENGKLYAHKANSYYNSGDPAAGTGAVITGIPDLQSVVFMALDGGVNYNSWHINFGQDSTFAGRKAAGGNQDENGYGDFAYAPPSGYLSLCSLNLPSGAIDTVADETPEDYFNTVLYTGNQTDSHGITGVGFQPSLTWVKERSSTSSHLLVDAVRGATKGLASNATTAEENLTAGEFVSFDSDGFTVDDNNRTNQSSQTYVGWNWKANGSGVSNTDGSITSTVSVGATSQQNWFSIVSYVGNKTAGATVGHGLGVVPDMIIVKNRDDTDGWRVYHSGVASDPETDYLELNSTAAAADSTNMWNDTAPTSSVFSLGTASSTNQTGEDLIAYCFANAENLCRVGSYTGNGSTDGTFVYTGFRPAWVMVKNASLAATSWLIWDEERSTYNIANDILKAQSSNAEVVDNNSFGIDILSNGFKVRSSYGDVNQSGNTIIFLAIASQPFKYSNAR